MGPVEWLKPYTDDSIRALGAEGKKAMLAVPISFVSEHIETLEEIDMEYREVAEESGIKGWRRVPALGCDQVFIDDLASAAIEALPYVDVNKAAAARSGQGEVENAAAAAAVLQGQSGLVPMGSVDALLETYDGDRKLLPVPDITVGEWEWGWTRSAELWNGRLAMSALAAILAFEILTGKAAFLLE